MSRRHWGGLAVSHEQTNGLFRSMTH